MAGNNILGLILGAGAAYIAYEWWISQPSAAAPAPVANTVPPTIPATVLTAAALSTYVAAQQALGQTPAQIQASLNALQSAQLACVAPSTWNTTTGSCVGVAYQPPSVTQQLQTAAGAGVTTLNADQWSYYWTQIGQPAIDGTKWQTVFFPQGRPSATTAEPSMTAAQYVSALQSAGLAGYRRAGLAAFVPVPVMLTYRGRGFGGGVFTLGDLRRAGRRY